MITLKNKRTIVGLEIGSTKISILIGEISEGGKINIIGFSSNPSIGVEKGKINNLELLIKCIKKSMHDAETMAKQKIKSIYLALSNKDIDYRNEIGIIPIKGDEVTQEDLKNVINTAKSVQIHHDHHVLHVIPQEYSIDQQIGIKNPIGLSGVRMQANVHLITCHHNSEKNVIKAVEKCGMIVKKTIFSGLASSSSVLTEEEKNLGVCVIDIGGGTMDINIYTTGSLRYSKVIPYAGDIVTNDIAYAFSISQKEAEYIKIKHGCVTKSLIGFREDFEISGSDGKKIKNLYQTALIEIIEPRYYELLQMINNEILKLNKNDGKKSIKEEILSGIVLTGGGSKIKFLKEFAEMIFEMPVRIKKPCNLENIPKEICKQEYSTIAGLLLFIRNSKKFKESYKKSPDILSKIVRYIKEWIKKEF